MKIYNTLTGEKEEFVPVQPGKVGIYVCGVTVYAPLHLGHIRSYVAYDVMVEYLRKFKNLDVMYIRNITDVGSVVGDADEGEDKIELKAFEQKMHPMELVDRNIFGMWQGLDAVRCARPNISPRASGHIVEIIEAVKKMIDNGFAYELDGNIYCDVSKIKDYGILSGNTTEKLSAGARIKSDERKHTPYDFAVWKKAQKNSVLKWNSPWGMGYPGWHIECSVMSTKYLGQTFDIHGGGRELAFPHHENEIAQNMALCGKQPAKYWVHTGMLNASDGTKMSKSKGNYVTVEDALKKYGAVKLRWLVAFAHYRAPITFSDSLFVQIGKEYERLENFVYNLKAGIKTSFSESLESELETLKQNFTTQMDDDFNTANALAEIFNFIKNANVIIAKDEYNAKNVQNILEFFEKMNAVFKVFDFLEEKQGKTDVTAEIEKLIALRNTYRQNRDFEKADEVKKQILSLGAEITDNKDGTTTFRIK